MSTGFILSDNAKNWFRNYPEKSKAKFFEYYYYCLLSGLAYQKKAELEQGSSVFIDYFPEDFSRESKLIVGLLISCEMKASAVSPSNRKEMHSLVTRIIAHDNSTGLTAEGISLLNQYAAGGYIELVSRMSDAPNSFDTFLKEFRDHLEEAPE